MNTTISSESVVVALIKVLDDMWTTGEGGYDGAQHLLYGFALTCGVLEPQLDAARLHENILD